VDLPPLCDKWGLPVVLFDFPSGELSLGSAGGFSLGFLLMITVRLPSTLPARQKSR
jgi:hypothetical protein